MKFIKKILAAFEHLFIGRNPDLDIATFERLESKAQRKKRGQRCQEL